MQLFSRADDSSSSFLAFFFFFSTSSSSSFFFCLFCLSSFFYLAPKVNENTFILSIFESLVLDWYGYSLFLFWRILIPIFFPSTFSKEKKDKKGNCLNLTLFHVLFPVFYFIRFLFSIFFFLFLFSFLMISMSSLSSQGKPYLISKFSAKKTKELLLLLNKQCGGL